MANLLTMTLVTSRRQTERVGFTLLELMLTLGLVLAIAAVAIPFSYREFIKQESVVARDRLVMQASQARAAARRSGIPYRMMVDVSGREVRVYAVDPRNPGSIDSGGVLIDQEGGDSDVQVLPESWQRTLLPQEMRIVSEGLNESDVLDEDTDFEPLESFGTADDEFLDDAWDQPAHIATFMPDGTVLIGESVVLEGSSLYRLSFNRWSGAILLEEMADVAAEDENRLIREIAP